MTLFEPVRFGKYLLLDKIATGGWAELYQGKLTGVEGFEKLIAIKMILPHLAQEKELVDSFIFEAKLAALLNHKNIVHIYDFGNIEGNYFIAMQYLYGKDLRRVINKSEEKEQALGLEYSLYIVSLICSGLGYAHSLKDLKGNPLNVIHRDVTPQNILITYDGEVKIVDFGIAKAAARSSLTQIGTIKGKVAYMSPEQADGQPIDRRSDVFSTGILLYELVTGRRMFTGDTMEILSKVRECEFEPPEAVSDLPGRVYNVLHKALESDPDDRYQSCDEMLSDLEACMYELSMWPRASGLSHIMRSIFKEEIIAEEAVMQRGSDTGIILKDDGATGMDGLGAETIHIDSAAYDTPAPDTHSREYITIHTDMIETPEEPPDESADAGPETAEKDAAAEKTGKGGGAADQGAEVPASAYGSEAAEGEQPSEPLAGEGADAEADDPSGGDAAVFGAENTSTRKLTIMYAGIGAAALVLILTIAAMLPRNPDMAAKQNTIAQGRSVLPPAAETGSAGGSPAKNGNDGEETVTTEEAGTAAGYEVPADGFKGEKRASARAVTDAGTGEIPARANPADAGATESAVRALEEGRFEEAVQLFQTLVERDPATEDQVAAYYARALQGLGARLIKSAPDRARAHFLQAARYDPDNVRIHFQLGLLYIRLKEYRNAIAQYKKVVDLDRESPVAFFNLGYAYARIKAYEKAEEMYARTVALNPSYRDEALFNMAIMQYLQQKRRLAINNLKKALTANPDNKKARQYLDKLEKEIREKEA